MENFANEHNENFCPECGCNITEAREEEQKEQLFGIKYSQELILIRKRARKERMLGGAIIFMLFMFFLASAMPRSVWGTLVTESGFNYLSFFAIVFGLVGCWWGTMWQGMPREEKKLWKNFIKKYEAGN